MKQQIRNILLRLRARSKRLYLSFGHNVKCPICGWTGSSFLKISYPMKPADSFICPLCGSSERHRYAYYMLHKPLAAHAEATLHFAPETCIEPWLRSISKDYLSVDLMSPSAMRHMDITKLELEDNSFSLLWCSHVLEHIENDSKAMAELFRVLRPSGLAVIMVPVYGSHTYENPEVKSPSERLKYFKQHDHVRLYGLDIKLRLQNAGFSVEVMQISDIQAEAVQLHVLEYPSTKEIFLCTKSQ